MSYHEKTRWAGLAANILIWGWYFASAFGEWQAGTLTGQNSFGGVVLAIIGTVIIQIVANAAIAIHRSSDAQAGLDERDRQIADKAAASAYTLLSIGLVLVVGAAYFAIDYIVAINLLMLVFIAVECVRYMIEIAAYRRGFA